MQLRFLRIIDRALGHFALRVVAPLCGIAGTLLPLRPAPPRARFAFLKLHGGGSLIVAMPALLGLRLKFPEAEFILAGTEDTRRYAELTGIFDRFVMIETRSPFSLAASSWQALSACHRIDAFCDLEPHSVLAAVFTAMTFAARRIGLVKGYEMHRARAYTDALYFNFQAPIHAFYAQMAAQLGASPATDETCRERLRAAVPPLEQRDAHPAITSVYLSPFSSGLSQERMMPPEQWAGHFKRAFGASAISIVIGGGPKDIDAAEDLASRLRAELPAATVRNICGACTLPQAAQNIAAADQFWGIDSGPLHIARMLGKRCMSFWGPTNPRVLLKPIDGLQEDVIYLALACSPCVHVSLSAPCGGDNTCMKLLLDPPAATPPIVIGSRT